MSDANILAVKLEVIVGPAKGDLKEFKKDLILIGRNPDNDFSIGADQKISRTHVELHVGSDKVIVRNISERNFMLVSGKEVNEAVLNPGEIIFIGESQIRVNFDLPEQKKALVRKEMRVDESRVAPARASSPIVNSQTPIQLNKTIGSPNSLAPTELNTQAPTARSQSSYNFSNMKQAEAVSNEFSKVPSQSKLRFNLIHMLLVIVVSVAGFFIFYQNEKKKAKSLPLRTNITSVQNIQQSSEALEEFNKQIAPKKTINYEQAQQQYLKGFRDYRNGNYARAMEHFAAALAFYSDHDQAKRYYQLAKRKNEEFAQYHFNLGKRYYGIQNYRLCSAHFAIVLRSKRDEKDPIRAEALQYYKECEARQEGRY
jgi:hypothetical protein